MRIANIAFSVVISVTCLWGCSGDSDRSATPDSGTTKRFHILSPAGAPCSVKRLASDAEAQKICVELGYSEYVSYVVRHDCAGEHSNQGWIEDVTCWKP